VLRAEPFPCPSCGKALRISPYYLWVSMVVTPLLSAFVAYLVGFRGLNLLIVIAVLWIPVGSLVLACLYLVVEPKIQAYYPDYLDLNPRV
jgi:hypothetical protein